MILGAISVKNLSGPITIAKVAGASAASGLESFISFLAYLSISLGVLNLLPIPMLDGGHLVYYFVELVRGRPVSEKVQMFGMRIGMALLFSLMALAMINDIARL
jgi:regulator of sigma E protease